MNKQDIVSKALSYFDEGYACSQSVLLAFSEELNLDERTAKLISSTFGGECGFCTKNVEQLLVHSWFLG